MEENKSATKTSVAGIIGLVFAILAILLSAVPIVNNFAFALAIIAAVCSIIALRSVKKDKRSGKGIAIATLIIAIVSCGIVLATQAMYGKAIDEAGKQITDTADRASGAKTNEILGKDVDVTIGQFSATTDQYGLSKTELPVSVTNKLTEKKSYNIHIEAVDAAGKRIDDTYVYANDLNANQSQDFKAFEYVSSDKLEAIKSAKFNIVEVSEV